MAMDKKALVVKYRQLVSLACRLYNLPNLLRRRIKGKGNRIEAPCALMKRVDIRISGSNNRVIIEDFAVLIGVSVYITGDYNTLTIGSWCHLNGTEVCMEKSGNTVAVGSGSKLMGKTHLAALEGTRIDIGRDCLFSSDIHFRTGDSHSVLDRNGRRINPSQDISLGEHVWVGTKVICLKGTVVPAHSIVGAGALVTKAFSEPHCVLAGNPAKVVKTGVNWSLKRIPIGETAADFQPFVN